MIGYLDTSAVVPLLVAEPNSPLCRRLWDEADTVVSCRLLHVEAAAALSQAGRLGRISAADREAAMDLLDSLWERMDVVEVDDLLVREASALAHQHGLRGYDAVHCASARQLVDDDLVAATGDRLLLAAWSELGVSTLDTNQ